MSLTTQAPAIRLREVSTNRADRPFSLPIIAPCGRVFRCDRRETSDGSAKAWIEEIAQAIAENVERADGEKDRKPRKEREPELGADEVPALADHDAPLGSRRLCPEANEAEAGRGDDGRAHVEARLDHQRSECVRKEVPPEDPSARRADRARRLDELATAQRQKLAAREPRVDRPGDGGDGNDRVREARTEGAV